MSGMTARLAPPLTIVLSLLAVPAAAAAPRWLRVGAVLCLLAAAAMVVWVTRRLRAERDRLERCLAEQAGRTAGLEEAFAARERAIQASAEDCRAALGGVRGALPDLLEDAVLVQEYTAALTANLAQTAGDLALILDEIGTYCAGLEDCRSRLASSGGPATPAGAVTLAAESIGRLAHELAMVEEGVGKVEAVVAQAGKAAAETGRTVQAVADLAEQARILGVNASIEALRAGEAGRGFTLIAEDAARLADRLNRAAHQMAVRIEDQERILAEAGKTLVRMRETAAAGHGMLNGFATAAAAEEHTRAIQGLVDALAHLHARAGALSDRLAGLRAALTPAGGEEGGGATSRILAALREVEADLRQAERTLAEIRAGAEAAAAAPSGA